MEKIYKRPRIKVAYDNKLLAVIKIVEDYLGSENCLVGSNNDPADLVLTLSDNGDHTNFKMYVKGKLVSTTYSTADAATAFHKELCLRKKRK